MLTQCCAMLQRARAKADTAAKKESNLAGMLIEHDPDALLEVEQTVLVLKDRGALEFCSVND